MYYCNNCRNKSLLGCGELDIMYGLRTTAATVMAVWSVYLPRGAERNVHGTKTEPYSHSPGNRANCRHRSEVADGDRWNDGRK